MSAVSLSGHNHELQPGYLLLRSDQHMRIDMDREHSGRAVGKGTGDGSAGCLVGTDLRKPIGKQGEPGRQTPGLPVSTT